MRAGAISISGQSQVSCSKMVGFCTRAWAKSSCGSYLERLLAVASTFRMRPLRTSQRMARRHSPTSLSRMGRLFLNILMAAGLWGRPVLLSLKRGFLRTRRMWTIRLTLFLYSLNSQSGLRPESITHPMYLSLLKGPSWIHQRIPNCHIIQLHH
jgi:hypothetical protein